MGNLIKNKISIIIPCYNVEKYIDETITSVLKQKYDNYEIILINDGSTDRTGEICEEYQRKYNNINVFFQKNSGPAKARNIGLKYASGEYVVFLDSDDILVDDALIKINKKINEKSADVLLGQMYEIVFPRGTVKKRINLINIEFDNHEVLKNIIRHSPISITYIWRNVYRREYIIKNQIFFQEKVLCAEDMDWNTRIFLNNPSVSKIDFYTHRYRGNRIGSIVTENSFDKVYGIWLIAKKWFDEENIKDIELRNCINEFYSEAVISNLKYIYNYNNKQKEKLIGKIQESIIWDNPLSNKSKKIVILKKRIGIKWTLKILNLKYKFFMIIKKICIKLKFIDR